MKISFLVTFYNQEKYVKRALDSILAIDIPCDYEILVADDGSTDSTVEIIKEYIKIYPNIFNLIIRDRNDGEIDPIRRVSKARTALFTLAIGDYYMVLDGDDCFCDTTFINEALATFQDDPSLSVVCFDYKEVFENGKEIFHSFTDNGKLNKSKFINMYYTHVGTCLLKHNSAKENFDLINKLVYFDDNDIIMDTLAFGDIFHIKRTIYEYMQHEDSSWNSSSYLEKSFLNCLNYDIEKQYIYEYKENLFYRSFEDILILYLLKENIVSLMGDKLYQKCMRRCTGFEDGITYWLITGQNICTLQYNKIIKKYICKRPKIFLRSLINVHRLKGKLYE